MLSLGQKTPSQNGAPSQILANFQCPTCFLWKPSHTNASCDWSCASWAPKAGTGMSSQSSTPPFPLHEFLLLFNAYLELIIAWVVALCLSHFSPSLPPHQVSTLWSKSQKNFTIVLKGSNLTTEIWLDMRKTEHQNIAKKQDFFSTMTNYQIPSQTIHGQFFSWDPDDCVVGLLLPGNFLRVWWGGGGFRSNGLGLELGLEFHWVLSLSPSFFLLPCCTSSSSNSYEIHSFPSS